jgi:acyl-CoA synthetase (AMP-forming)/AMP-acid ligase II
MYKNRKLWDIIVQNRTLQPDFIILSDSNGNYTWQQLFDLVEKHTKQPKSEEPFFVFYSVKNVHSVAVILSCLMQNKTFIPVSREQPIERIRAILESLNQHNIYDPSTGTFEEISKENFVSKEQFSHQSIEECFYVLFTSGSTGTPKGVKISEANMINTLEWSSHQFSWNVTDVIGIVTAFHFDISLFDLFIALTKGIRMHIFSDNINAQKLCNEIFEIKVTSIFSTPSLFALIAKLNDPNLISITNLRRIISGGDFFLPSDIIYWYQNFPGIEMYNVWGPTETTIVNTAHKISNDDIARLKANKNISIGQSSTEMPIFICEPDTYPINILSQPQEVGEIVVLGESVGLGYLDGEIEAQKNFTYVDGRPAYRTGDLGFLEDGEIYMTGRKATLIKYQGYRIDPREIEAAVLELSNIRNACLVLVENNYQQHELVLLVEVNNNAQCDVSFIKYNLRKRVPLYMVPKKIIFLETIPVSKNGKLDRKECRLFAEEIGRLKID